MACFIVPGTEAVITTAVTKIIEKKEIKRDKENLSEGVNLKDLHKERFSAKLKKLNYMLWGGSALLAFEHLWHGEIQPFFPFLTAASNPVETSEMLHEMGTVGIAMAAVVTVAWGVVSLVSARIEESDSAAFLGTKKEN